MATLFSEERKDENGNLVTEQLSIAQLIVDDILNDGIAFINETNRKIFNIFNQAIDDNNIPDDQFFVSHEDPDIAQLAADLLSTPYKLDQWEKHGIFVKKEEDVLKMAVQSTIYRYKDLIIESRQKEIEEKLKTADDIADQFMLLKQKKDYDDIRLKLNKELGIVIAK